MRVFNDIEAVHAYDESCECVVREYELLHENLIDLVVRHCGGTHPALKVLDIGAGTGAETMALLSRFPKARVVALDSSREMLTELGRKLSLAGPEVARRCVPMVGDIASDEVWRKVGDFAGADRLNLVMSAFTIHHLARIDKVKVFRQIASHLSPRGLFLNLDVFSFFSSEIAKHALAHDLEWISNAFSRRAAGQVDPEAKERIRQFAESWKMHYLTENDAEPFDSPLGRGGLAEEMRNAGFEVVEMPIRVWQCGIAVAITPGTQSS